jgi:putative heme-binding domain-containing protein
MAKLEVLPPKHAEVVVEAAFDQKEVPWLRARAAWQLARLDKRLKMDHHWEPLESHHLFEKGEDPRFGQLALRMGKEWYRFSRFSKNDLELVLKHPSDSVRRELLLLLRDVDPVVAGPHILALAKRYDGKDRFYLAAIGIAVGHHNEKRREIILADFEKNFPQWNDKVAGLVWELRPPKILPLLEKRLTDSAISAEQRAKIVDILASSSDKGAGAAVLKLLQGDVPMEVRERAIENLKLYLPGKWQYLKISLDFERTLTALLSKSDTRTTAISLIALAGKTDQTAAVLKVAKSASEKDDIRKAAVQALGQLPADEAIAGLAELLSSTPAMLRVQAAMALGELGRRPGYASATKALQTLQAVVDDGKASVELREAAVTGLSGSRPGSVWLLDRHAKGKTPDALVNVTGRVLRNSPYPDLRNKALIAFPPAGRLNPKKLPSVTLLAVRKGDPNKGKRLLAESVKSNLQCLKCHTIRGVGGQIGPDLSMIGKKASRENLIESILYPSKAIADQYLTWQIDTLRGQTLSGLIVEESADAVVLRDAEGRDTRIAKKNIEKRTKGTKSLMPEDLVVHLSEDELIDLVEYLATLRTAALAVDRWDIIGPFDNGNRMEGLDRVFPPEKVIDLKASYPGKFGKVTWRTVKPGAGGYVDLAAFFAPDSRNIVSYLTREIVSPVDQDATVLLGSDDGAKLWIDGKLVHMSRVTRAAAPEQDTVKVRLKKGMNRILLKINNGDGPHGFYLTVLTEQELKVVGK